MFELDLQVDPTKPDFVVLQKGAKKTMAYARRQSHIIDDNIVNMNRTLRFNVGAAVGDSVAIKKCIKPEFGILVCFSTFGSTGCQQGDSNIESVIAVYPYLLGISIKIPINPI